MMVTKQLHFFTSVMERDIKGHIKHIRFGKRIWLMSDICTGTDRIASQ